MKKGFSSFSLHNPQANPNPQNNSNLNNLNSSNQDKLNGIENKQQQLKGFSSIKKQGDQPQSQNGIQTSQPAFQNPANSALRLNSGLANPIGGNVMANVGFGNYPMLNLDNPQYFPNSMPSFGDNSYAMLFNQFQNGASLTANSGSSQTMILTLFQIIESQSKSLQSLYGKVEKMTQRINQFGQKMKQIKKVMKQPPPEDQNLKPVIDQISQGIENIDSKTLIKILFGSNKVYNYKLELNESLQLPLYRERNFSISLKLTDNEGKIVKNNNKIPLSLAIYSSQNPPKFIQKNTAGQKILKGYIEQSLHFGQCRFQKIQIKEVTSHFRNGWVFIVIIPCMTPLGSANPNDSFIDYLKIQPLVLEKVVVKAKKIKEANKKEKQEKEESEPAEAKDSENGLGSQKQDEKPKSQISLVKAKTQQKIQQSEDIYEDK